MNPPIEIKVANRYTGPGLKHVAFITLAVVGVMAGAALTSKLPDNSPPERPLSTAIAETASQPLDLNDRANPAFQGRAFIKTINARIAVLDEELRNWQPTGNPADADRITALRAERKMLTGE
ncbi:hypothetical protein BH20VER3_BH20VER3_00840 [soil metagenome]